MLATSFGSSSDNVMTRIYYSDHDYKLQSPQYY